MLLCLEAAADAGIEFVILDRPILDGERVEGPSAIPSRIFRGASSTWPRARSCTA